MPRTWTSFNPLHCGAVVASLARNRSSEARLLVSIPFIAGQWSLRRHWLRRSGRHFQFQSPSLRGSGRFPPPSAEGGWGSGRFQSPSLRGSGRFDSPPPHGGGARRSFNPLHCGAVVASSLAWGVRVSTDKFQSPSLRGSGRFKTAPARRSARGRFQSPSLRGSGRFASHAPPAHRC